MRTRRTAILTGLLLAVLSMAADGRDMAGKLGITPQIGLVIPAGEFGDDRGIGFKYGVDVDYFVANNASCGLRWFHDDLPYLGDFIRPHFGFGHNEDIWPIDGFGVQLKYYRAATPFTDAFGRLGFLLCRMEFPISRPTGIDWDFLTDREMENSWGLELGLGLARHLSRRFSIYGEVEYALFFTKGLRIKKEPTNVWHEYRYSYNAQTVAIKTGLTFYLGGPAKKPRL